MEQLVEKVKQDNPSFVIQEEKRLFQATGALAAMRHHLYMAVRMLASRPMNVETGLLDRDAKIIMEQLIDGGHDEGIFSGAASPFQGQDFKEFVEIMARAQEEGADQLVLTPVHTNAYNEALQNIVVPRQEETQTALRLCLQKLDQQGRQLDQQGKQLDQQGKQLDQQGKQLGEVKVVVGMKGRRDRTRKREQMKKMKKKMFDQMQAHILEAGSVSRLEVDDICISSGEDSSDTDEETGDRPRGICGSTLPPLFRVQN
jgi:hypothetical protein